jgi:hypothetical protein
VNQLATPRPTTSKTTPRIGDRRKVNLPGRLTWRDGSGTLRFVSVVTRDMSDVDVFVECQIPASGHLVDDRLTLADIAVASPFANFAIMGLAVDSDRYPKTSAFVAATLGRPSFDRLIERDNALRLFPGLKA